MSRDKPDVAFLWNKTARSDGYLLAVGLGALGVGRMWVKADTDDPRVQHLPYVADTRNGTNLYP
jgi:hypothetical protein